MGYKKQSMKSILVALTVMLLGLFMLCAYRQTSMNPGVNLSDEDLQFRMELLDMLEMETQDGDASMFVSNDAPTGNTGSMSNSRNNELLALMEATEEEDGLPLFVADTQQGPSEFEYASGTTSNSDEELLALFEEENSTSQEPVADFASNDNDELASIFDEAYAAQGNDDVATFSTDDITPQNNDDELVALFSDNASTQNDDELVALFSEDASTQNENTELVASFQEDSPSADQPGQFAASPQIEKGEIDELFSEAYEEDSQDIATFSDTDDMFEQELRRSFSDGATVADTRTSSAPKTNYYSKLAAQLNELEIMLQKRSTQVDSLIRVVKNREARIKDLEHRVASVKNKTNTTAYASTFKKVPTQNPAAAASNSTGNYRSEPMRTASVPSTSFYKVYDQAKKNFNKFNYDACIAQMQSLLEQYPNHKQADNCQYWVAECYFGKKQYDKAILEFQKVFAYDEEDKHDDAQLMIGLAYIKLGQKQNAQAAFGEFLENYEYSEYKSVANRYFQNI